MHGDCSKRILIHCSESVCVCVFYMCVNESAAVLLFNMMTMVIKMIVKENSLVILTFPFPKMYKCMHIEGKIWTWFVKRA